MRGRIPKLPNFLALCNQQQEEITIPHSEQPTSQSTTSAAPAITTTQAKRSSDSNRRSPSYYGFDNSTLDLTIEAQPKRPRRAGDVENFQPPSAKVFETVQHIAEQQLVETNISR